eukprot:6175568-Pleurochrysis_carterae.AAC.2
MSARGDGRAEKRIQRRGGRVRRERGKRGERGRVNKSKKATLPNYSRPRPATAQACSVPHSRTISHFTNNQLRNASSGRHVTLAVLHFTCLATRYAC